MAQKTGVAEFITGTELTAFSRAPGWAGLDRDMRRWYHGTLACADNWPSVPARACGTAVQAVDAYAPEHAPILAGWERYDAALPAGITETEVGIAAAPHADSRPYRHSWPVTRLDQGVQARWLAAACTAAVREHLGGIYFWSVGLGPPGHGPTLDDQGAWSGGEGAAAISACFAAIERTTP